MTVTNKPRWPLWILACAALYFLAAYLLAPKLWIHHESIVILKSFGVSPVKRTPVK